MKPKLEYINPIAIITIMVALALGFTGKVDWWVIILIALAHTEVRIRL